MRFFALFLLLVSTFAPAQAGSPKPKQGKSPRSEVANARDISGMYTFLQDGEFVQVTQEDDGTITGFISRYGTLPSDKGAFLDQFFKSASLKGDALEFTTEAVHGVTYSFRGTVNRGPGKQAGDESYWLLHGTLVETTTGPDEQPSARSRQVEFKSFPKDAGADNQ